MFNKFLKKYKDEEKSNENVENKSLKDSEVEENASIDNIEKNREGFLSRFKKGLEKTKRGISDKVDDIIKSYQKIDDELFEELEEVLIMADIGFETTERIIEEVKDKVKERKITDANDIKLILKEELKEILEDVDGKNKLNINPYPAILLVVGVNGVGKTTTIGKLAYRFKEEGRKVLLTAGDTFRAAAIEQLGEWANRANVDIISHSEGSDPAAVIFDGIQAAKARNVDILICDTAGRLHNKKNLMNELNKIFRVVAREYPDANKEVLLVVDATTGQNAIMQAKVFKEACDITGIALTKLDGTAKGGVVFAVQSELDVPVKLVGVGEGINDLQDFDSEDFVDAIFPE
ncbi:signal recognition particle-docking protein FtsY [Clostridium sp. D2Q-14]|uniref:signal recognition particle-docking protein FtsY n=1 Tax=Anaeromonas gelatinilytica TaxID=2683194 RepID=UPI00193BA13B|nr:signal recognition particle-docking protein FtsY [Anaeromonas gelatinilytica]MBS4536078.1 signal recognition particle-docking protein FtsY [Anaeromonas gelatinilytica]